MNLYIPAGAENDHWFNPSLRHNERLTSSQREARRRRNQRRRARNAQVPFNFWQLNPDRQLFHSDFDNFEDVQPPANIVRREDINTLCYSRFQQADFSKTKNKQCKDCVICGSELWIYRPKVNIPCKHIQFHPSCIFEWLSRKDECPLCRRQILSAISDEMRQRAIETRRQRNINRNLRQKMKNTVKNRTHQINGVNGRSKKNHNMCINNFCVVQIIVFINRWNIHLILYNT